MNKEKFSGIDHPIREVRDLKDLINSSAELFSDKAAYLQKDAPGGTFKAIRYSQVKKDMDALGTKFIDMGLKGEKIAVIGETAYHWFLTYYAVVCGTGVVVPLDKNLPEEEIENLIRRSGAKALIYSKKMEKKIEGLFDNPYDLKYFVSMREREHTDKVLSLRKLISEGRELLEEGNRDFVDAEIDPNQMATLIFTSGTTGLAKGVMLSHKNIVSNVMNMSRRMMLGEDWVILSILPTHHTFENTCVDWTTFYQGKTLAICEGVKYIQKNMNEVKANCMVGVPLVFEKLYKGMMKQAESSGQGEKLRNAIDLSRRLKLYNNPAIMKRMFKSVHDALGGGMQQFIAGGAAIDPQVIKDFEAMGIPMMQGYGMTECSPIIAVNQDNYGIAESVGRPMHGTTVKIDDPGPDGIGEIVVKSPSVMLGYYEDEAATAEVSSKPGISKKFALVGFVLGIILYAIVYILYCGLKGNITSPEQTERYSNSRLLGEIYYKGTHKGLKGLLNSSIVNGIRCRGKKDTAKQISYITSTIDAVCRKNDAAKVTAMCLPGISAEDHAVIRELEASIKKKGVDLEIIDVDFATVEEKLLSIDFVVCVANEESKAADLINLASLLKSYDTKIIGNVFIQGV